MKGAKVSLNHAERVKKFLIKSRLLDFDYRATKGKQFIIFPVLEEFEDKDVEFIEDKFSKKRRKETWKDILKNKLGKVDSEKLITAHDLIGNIAILEIPEELVKKEKIIADTFLNNNKNVKTVLKKAGEHTGTFRTQKMKWIGGENTKDSVYKENGVKLKVNVEDMYFSVRLGTERKRIMKQIEVDEHVLVMFSGCAPYPCVFSKNTDAERIVGIEINPKAHEYGLINLQKNKISNVELFCGDVKKVVPELKERFDRVCMPLPKGAEDFLDDAIKISRKNAIIHFYDFLHENEFEKCEEKVRSACNRARRTFEVLDFVKCGQYSPGKFRVCLDFRVF